MTDNASREKLKTSVDSSVETIRHKHERVLAQLNSLKERLTSLQKSNQQLNTEASRESKKSLRRSPESPSALQAENAELKAADTKRALRMQEISNNFKVHLEKFEQERYELQQKIDDLQKNREEAVAQTKDVNQNEFLSREHSKELERLLNNKIEEYGSLQKKVESFKQEREAFEQRINTLKEINKDADTQTKNVTKSDFLSHEHSKELERSLNKKIEENEQLQKKVGNFNLKRNALEQKIITLQKDSKDAAAHTKDVNKNEFLYREQNKELERKLNNKVTECDQLQKNIWIMHKESAALKISGEGSSAAIKKRLKEIVKELKNFSDSLEKGKKEVTLQNERLEKHLLKKEKELYSKDEEIDAYKERVKTLQDEITLKENQPEPISSASDQSKENPGAMHDVQNLSNLLDASNEEKEAAINQMKQLQREIAQLKESLDSQKSEVPVSGPKDTHNKQHSGSSKDDSAMLEWYRTAFENRNKKITTAHSENLSLKEEIENLQEELEKFKSPHSGSLGGPEGGRT